jgi:hypothetical protein
MTHQQFIVQLGGTSALAAALLLLLHRIDIFAGHEPLSWGAWGAFIVLTITAYFAGLKTVKSHNKNHFSNTVFGFSMGKILVVAVSVLIYTKSVEPEGKLFIIPLFIVYAVFSVFETIMLSKIGRMQH